MKNVKVLRTTICILIIAVLIPRNAQASFYRPSTYSLWEGTVEGGTLADVRYNDGNEFEFRSHWSLLLDTEFKCWFDFADREADYLTIDIDSPYYGLIKTWDGLEVKSILEITIYYTDDTHVSSYINSAYSTFMLADGKSIDKVYIYFAKFVVFRNYDINIDYLVIDT